MDQIQVEEEELPLSDLEEDLLLPSMDHHPEASVKKGLLSMNKSVFALTLLSGVGGFLFG